MVASEYIIRNYQPADFNSYARLRQQAAEQEPAGSPFSPQTVAESLSRPYHSDQDLFLILRSGSIIGYMDISPEPGIGRVIISCWLRPEHRGKGLGTKLHEYAMRRARRLGAGFAHVNVREDNTDAITVLSGLGFECVRRFLELELDMSRLRWPEIDQKTRECRYLQAGEEDRLTDIQNRCFAGTWGYNPNTVATTSYRTSLSHFSWEDIVLACDGDKITGYCWTEVGREKDEHTGRIFMLGTDPDYRGQGIGRRLLWAGLARLRSRGVNLAVLTVDSENEAACALYHSVGFVDRANSLWYELAVTGT